MLLCLEVGLRLTSRLYWRTELGVSGQMHAIPEAATACATCTRILVVGDSYTFGFGASPGWDYPSVLRAWLEQRAPGRFVVINAGMGAANSTLARENLATYLSKIDADIVVILAGGSNALNLSQYYAYTWDDPRLATLERWLYEVRVIRLVRFTWSRRQEVLQPPRWDQDLYAVSWRAALTRGRRWYTGAPDRVPESIRASFEEGLDVLEAGGFEEAQDRFAALAKEAPTFGGARWAGALARLGLAFMMDREVDMALQEAVRLSPNDPNGYDALGGMYFQGRRINDAERWYRQGMAVAPGWAGLRCGLGNVLASREQFTDAIAELKEGIRLDPDDQRCYPALVEFSRRLGEQASTAEFLGTFSNSTTARNQAAILSEERKTVSAWMRSDLTTMARMAQARGARVVFENYPTQNEANPVLEAVARKEGALFVDQRAVFAARLAGGTPVSTLFIPDGHCSSEGYGLMGEVLFNALRQGGLLAEGGILP